MPNASCNYVESVSPIPDLFQAMAEELARARANKAFPPTTTPSTDVQATAHDYELLLQLQNARNPTKSIFSESYDHLFVEVARRIRDRDDTYNYEAHRDEAVRRVETYIRSVEHEREHFESVRSSSSSILSRSTPVSPVSPCSGGCSVAEVNEDVLSIYEQAAEQALSDLARPLMEGLEQYVDLHEEQRGLGNEQKALHHQQVALVSCQQAMVDDLDHSIHKCAKLVHNQRSLVKSVGICTQNLQGVSEDSAQNLVALQNTLNVAVSATNQLSHTVANLPQAIQLVVDIAVQEQTKIAIADISNAYQVALDEIDERKLKHLYQFRGFQDAEVGYCPDYDTAGIDLDEVTGVQSGFGTSRGRKVSTFCPKRLRRVVRRVLRLRDRH